MSAVIHTVFLLFCINQSSYFCFEREPLQRAGSFAQKIKRSNNKLCVSYLSVRDTVSFIFHFWKYCQKIHVSGTAWKVFVFRDFLVHILPHSDWIRIRETPSKDVFTQYGGNVGLKIHSKKFSRNVLAPTYDVLKNSTVSRK